MSRSIQPGATIGVLGGGHAARMIALAAHQLGYRVHVLEDERALGGAPAADRVVHGRLTNLRAVAELARSCDVVTTAVEQVPPAALATAAHHVPVRPDAVALAVAQDRAREREWLGERGFNLGVWGVARSAAETARAVAHIGPACYVKPRLRRSGAAGPILVTTAAEAEEAWRAHGGQPCVVEAALDIDLELCVLVARTPDGAVAAYPPSVSRREHTQLLWSVIPGDLPEPLAQKARSLATFVAAKLGVEGLLAVEMFLLRDGRLVVNELVPCPHHTYVGAETACATDQFEQLVRAVCGLPLGATDVVQPAAISPVTGDLWRADAAPAFHESLALPGVKLHLYGEGEPHPHRTMGHLCATGDTAAEAVEAVEAVQSAKRRLARAGARRTPEVGLGAWGAARRGSLTA